MEITGSVLLALAVERWGAVPLVARAGAAPARSVRLVKFSLPLDFFGHLTGFPGVSATL